MYKLVIPGRLPGLNEIIGASSRHWAVHHRIKRAEMEKVGWLAKQARLPKFERKVSVTIACFEPNARRDPNNVQGGADKIILDALQNVGVLAGDGRKYIDLIPVPVEVDRENPRIEVTIWEEEPGDG